ncbi:MAG: hypothetical protein Q4Q53_03520 [Methanocorpusculum sp.]|nr:hypothetical protein [Methanocorpusculum sp.]
MKSEEIDWAIFHMIPEKSPVTISKLIETSGFDRETVESSLNRLENNCLIAVMGETVNALSIEDMFMINEIKYDKNSLVEIENGIIRIKK